MSLTVEPIEILVQSREIEGFFEPDFFWKETGELWYINSKALYVMQTFFQQETL